MRIAFIGTSELGVPSLEALKEQGLHETLVFTKPDQVGGRGRKILSSPLKTAALRLGFEPRTPANINDPEVIQEIRDFQADVIVTASFWAKLSSRLLEAPRLGGLNIHPSLLPLYRGAAPVQFALLRGDRVSGVTIFRMGRRMDAGEILGQVQVPVSPLDNYNTLHMKLSLAAAPLLLRVLENLEKGTARPRPQDETRVVMARKLTKSDGRIRWEGSAEEIMRKIRAFSPWPGAFIFFRVRGVPMRILITEGRVLKELPSTSRPVRPGTVLEGGKRLIVACRGGALEILRLKREGKQEMTAEEFLRGMRLKPGTALDTEDPVP